MAYHLRKQCRDAIASIVIAANTGAGSRVYPGRIYPLSADGPWPQVTIVSEGEQIRTSTLGAPRRYERLYRVRVHAMTKAVGESATEDALDALGMQIEVALANAYTLNGAAKYINLVQTLTETSADADEPLGRLTMIYEVNLMALETAPDVLT